LEERLVQNRRFTRPELPGVLGKGMGRKRENENKAQN